MTEDPKKNETDKPEADKTEVAESDTLKVRLAEAKALSPVLVIISGKPLGKSFFLSKKLMVVGRDLQGDITINESSISRRHTEFEITEEGIKIRDLKSTNGTFLNDEPLTEEKTLKDGDLVRCGNTLLKFLKEGKIENLHYGKMYDLATTDSLTQTLNKKAILELLEEEFNRNQLKDTPLSLIMFDLDHYKQINEKYTHPAGDYVLREICQLIMNKLIRQKDVLGRYGGEEFLLILRDTPLRVAVEVAERIRSTTEKNQFFFEGTVIPVTISIGVAALDSTTKTHSDLLALADKALLEAKAQGRYQVCVR